MKIATSSRPIANTLSLAGPSRSIAKRPLLILAGLLLLALLLRLQNFTESLWEDELWAARILFGDTDLLRTLIRDIHPPLHSAFMFSWVSLLGDSELSLRLPSLVSSLLAIVLSWAIARRYTDQTTALLTALLLSISSAVRRILCWGATTWNGRRRSIPAAQSTPIIQTDG